MNPCRLPCMARLLATVVPALLLLAACAPSQPQAATDCWNQIRLDGVVYNEAGFTEQVGPEAGEADLSECADVGESPGGSYFPDSPHVTIAYEVESFDPAEVLAVDDGNFVRVYLSDATTLERETTLRAQLEALSP